MQIELTPELTEQLEARVATSEEFDSVQNYVSYVLQQVLAQTATPTTAAEDAEKMESEDAKAAQVQERLKSLGYLD